MTAKFETVIREHFASSREHPQYQVWLDYALSTNTRGTQLVTSLAPWAPSFQGLRTLDVGSGYGGTCIAMAKAGASASGIEIDQRLLSFAAENVKDHPGIDVTMTNVDAMDWSALSALGQFDVITCDNVIEHVPVPQVLVAHLRRLLTPSGVLYLTAPNAFSAGQIRSDCHYGRFGLSLLDPMDGETFVKDALGQPSYDVSEYFSSDEYRAMFDRFGLWSRLMNGVGAGETEMLEVKKARESLGAMRWEDAVPASMRPKVSRLLKEHLQRWDADLRWFDAQPEGSSEREALAHRLYRDYVIELWYFVLSPTRARIEPESLVPPRPIREEARVLAGRVLTKLLARAGRVGGPAL
ncbi:MAG: methyltransferase domain-containing protein [Myxococcales bacterium]|nr:methyltransferase domain-containing protein [Myxococcales bacterium]MDP3504330.1 methyltransferase domain-containing protein [Myxococcales bacterium]